MHLLSILDAALVCYFLYTKQDYRLAFNPESKLMVFSDEKDKNQLCMHQVCIENAIKAGVLPAKAQSRGKLANKKMLERCEVPSEIHDLFDQNNYWITIEDLFTFLETSSSPNKDYAHGRDALARLVCALIDPNELNEKNLNEYLAQKIETAEQKLKVSLKLGDNTLKGCCQEILDNYAMVQT